MPTTSVEQKVENREYTSNSDFIRYAIRRILYRGETLSPKAIAKLNQRMDYDEENLVDIDET